MTPSSNQKFTTIRAEGGLLPSDFLTKIFNKQVEGANPESYGLEASDRINEAINRSWNWLVGTWSGFQKACKELPEEDRGTTLTREKWLLLLFQELGYGRLTAAKNVQLEGKIYPISHIWNSTPIHLVGFKIDLDKRTSNVAGAATSSPHSLVQEFLNRSSNHMWAFISNGLRLRILRDSSSLTRQAYVEFDLEAMMEGECYSDFVMLWLLCHESRVRADRPENCWLEKWCQQAKEEGTRALDHLREGVETAIKSLGTGFLAQANNVTLREKLREGKLDKQDYYRQILRLVYRIIFLLVAEERDLLFKPGTASQIKQTYFSYYSIRRLKNLCAKMRGTKHVDFYEGLRLVMNKLGSDEGCPELGLTALGSFLWAPEAIKDIYACKLENNAMIQAIKCLAYRVNERIFRAIDYKNLGAEELGSIYEALLELHPVLNLDAATFDLSIAAGHERKTTGSYYTHPSLVQCLLDSALNPVLDEAAAKKNAEESILDLKVCDPACGSGHFLIAAAHRIAKRLAAIRTGDAEPSPDATRKALRDVIGHCIYGVDINPMSVELCKVSLWMEAMEPGKPLSFLENKIQCGNSLLGATPALLKKGIPDEAFTPIEGDDKEFCKRLKKRNKDERQGQGTLFDVQLKPWDQLGNLAAAMTAIDEAPEESLADIKAKQKRYEEFVRSSGYLYGRLLADAWCAAFVWEKIEDEKLPHPITESTFRTIEKNPNAISRAAQEKIANLSKAHNFFHWHIAFPEVFYVSGHDISSGHSETGWEGGFDVVLGNPPWEKINLKDEEFFAITHPQIANASNKARRKELLQQLEKDEPITYARYEEARQMHDRLSIYFRHSGRYPLTGISRINLYSVFCETGIGLMANRGRIGMVIASGIATDDNNKLLFISLIDAKRLVHIWDFENSNAIFPGVHRSYKFSLFCAGGVGLKQTHSDLAFYLRDVSDLSDSDRHFSLTADDLQLLNPVSRTCPTFRSRQDAELSKYIYRKTPAFSLHRTDAEWPGMPKTPFNMSNDANLFHDGSECNDSSVDSEQYLSVYESKFIHQFNHRYATFGVETEDGTRGLTSIELRDPTVFVKSRYWLESSTLRARYPGRWHYVYRMIVRATDEHTSVACIIPQRPCVNSVSIIENISARNAASQVAEVNSFVHDYCARQKVSGTNFNHWIWHQLPILPFEKIVAPLPWGSGMETLRDWLLPRVVELSYTAWDLELFAQDCGYTGAPFCWDEDRRFLLRCELDAAFFHLYLGSMGEWSREPESLTVCFPTPRHAVDYIMDTFPIVKQRDEDRFENYRTKETILEIYDDMAEAIRAGKPYKTRLDPPPADPRVAHPPKSKKMPTGRE